MKKLILVLSLCVSAISFAQGDHSKMEVKANQADVTKVEKHIHIHEDVNTLTPEQQKEFNKILEANEKEIKKFMIEIEQVDLEIEKEKLSDNPSAQKINKLVDKRFDLKTEMEKTKLNHKIKIKKKFGLDLIGKMDKEKCKEKKSEMKEKKC